MELEIDGIHLELKRAPGETDDQIAVWYEAQKVLFSGDNFYACWPNLYALRGTPYRDVDRWVRTLDMLLTYPAEYLLPGHTAPIIGAADINGTLKAYRDAMDYILDATLEGIANGRRMDELAQAVELPPELKDLPFLGEFYGTVEWSVKGIYNGYVGWFDGNPTSLHPLSDQQRADRMIALIGDRAKIQNAAEDALSEDPQWTAELTDLLLHQDEDDEAARLLKAQALEALAELETSANGRHYYLEYAKELRSGTLKK